MLKKISASMLALCLVLLLGISAYAATISVSFSGMSLSPDGTASWAMSGTEQQVDSYQLQLYRKSSGNWSNSAYRSASTGGDTSYEFSFSSTGVYKFKVRAKFYGGDYSEWSDFSPEVTVTRDDISSSVDDLDIYQDYYDRYNSYGPGYKPDGSYLNGGYGGSLGPGVSTPTVGVGVSGWQTDQKGVWYRYSNGTYPSNGWHLIDTKWYYFDQNGYRQTGWISWNNNWYYVIPEGYMATGWNYISGKWYYMNENGIMQTGYVTVGGFIYYLDSSGARAENTFTPDGHYFNELGVMIY